MIETTTPWLWLYSMLGIVIGYGIYLTIKDNAFQAGYWKGRKDGYDMHRRITDAKRDQVFDYDKN
jgi:predicted membrane chloride channel (bestrophin family)